MTFFRPLAWRPALLAALCFACGLGAAGGPLWPFLGLAVALACPGWAARGIGGVAVLLGVMLRPLPVPAIPSVIPGPFDAAVATLPRAVGSGSSFIAEVPGVGRVTAFAETRGLAMGDRIRVEGRVAPLARGADDYLVSRRVVGKLRIRSLVRTGRGAAWAVALAETTNRLASILEGRLGPERGRLVGAIVFNFDGALDDEQDETLRRSGAYHLVSASGLHAQVVAAAVAAFGLIVPIRRVAWIPVGFLVILLYCLLTGWHAATIRAAVMWALASAAYAFRRSPDPLSALGIFVVIWLAVNPADIYDLGFALTTIVTAVIVAPRLGSGVTIFNIRTALIAWVASEIVLMYALGRWQPLALPANLALGIASTGVLIFGALAVLPWWLGGTLFAAVAGALADGLYAIARAFGTPGWAVQPTPWMTGAMSAGGLILLLSLWLGYEARRCAPLPD